MLNRFNENKFSCAEEESNFEILEDDIEASSLVHASLNVVHKKNK